MTPEQVARPERMVERVARAICCPNGCDEGNSLLALGCQARSWKPEARAVLTAMREPTEVMAETGADAFAEQYGTAPIDPCEDKCAAVEIYRDMIDAALADKVPGDE